MLLNFLFCLYRPLSKTVRFNVLKVIPAGTTGGGKKAFIAA
jgi:small subunit ribosomal protein S11e